MANTIHSTINNQAGATIELRPNDDGTRHTWHCNGCKTTSHPNPLPGAQREAVAHANTCRFN